MLERVWLFRTRNSIRSTKGLDVLVLQGARSRCKLLLFSPDGQQLRSLTFSPNGMLGAAYGEGGQLVVWDVDL
jgi:hypothetical protein